MQYAKSSAGWSAYLNGLQVDYETFKDEGEHGLRICEDEESRVSLIRASGL